MGSNWLIIQAVGPGIDIFDETGEIRVFLERLGVGEKKWYARCSKKATSTNCVTQLRERAQVHPQSR